MQTQDEYVDDRHQFFKILLHEEIHDPEEFIDNEEFLMKTNGTFKRQESFESPDELLSSLDVSEIIESVVEVVVKNEDVSEIIESVVEVVIKNEDVSEIIESVVDVVIKNEDVSEIIESVVENVVVIANEHVDHPVEILKILENKNIKIERIETVETEAQVLHTVRLDSFEEDQKNKKYTKNLSETIPVKKSTCVVC